MTEGWVDRLWKAIEADGRSDRALSVDAGLGVNYLSQTRSRGTHPVSEKLAAILAQLGPEASLYVLTGVKLGQDDLEFLALMGKLSPEQQRAARDFFQSLLGHEGR